VQLQIDTDLHEMESLVLRKNGRGLIEILCRHLVGKTEKTYEYFSQFSQCPDRDSSRTLPTCNLLRHH